MNLTANSLKNPAAIAVIVTIILLFGGYSLTRLPVQLFPDIENPKIANPIITQTSNKRCDKAKEPITQKQRMTGNKNDLGM